MSCAARWPLQQSNGSRPLQKRRRNEAGKLDGIVLDNVRLVFPLALQRKFVRTRATRVKQRVLKLQRETGASQNRSNWRPAFSLGPRVSSSPLLLVPNSHSTIIVQPLLLLSKLAFFETLLGGRPLFRDKGLGTIAESVLPDIEVEQLNIGKRPAGSCYDKKLVEQKLLKRPSDTIVYYSHNTYRTIIVI